MKSTLTFLILFLFISCRKNNDKEAFLDNVVGKWTLVEIFGNDYYGGPAYWKKTNGITKIELTMDRKYYRKQSNDSNYIFMGTYRQLSDSTIQIIWANPINPNSPNFTIKYTFSEGGYMTWGDYGFEHIIKEKFKQDK